MQTPDSVLQKLITQKVCAAKKQRDVHVHVLLGY